MTQKNVITLWLTIAALALGATACIGSPDSAAEEDVAVAAEALGGFTELVNVGGSEPPLDMGSSYTVFRKPIGACNFVDVVFTKTGQHVPVPALPGCPNITAAASPSNVYVADQTSGKIYTLNPDGSGNYSWLPLGDTNHANVVSMAHTNGFVWWYADSILYQLDVFSGINYVGPTFSGDLLGGEGTAPVYINAHTSDGSWELRKVADTRTSTVLARRTESFAPGFSFDVDNFYWVESVGGVNKVRSMPKAGGTVSTFRSSETVRYHAPVSNGSFLYWLEETVSGGSTKIRRKNLTNGNIVEASFPFTWSDLRSQNQLRLLSDAIYLTPYISSAPAHWSLYRTAL